MDVQMLGIHPDPYSLTPRKLTSLYLMGMASHRRFLAMQANAMMVACGAGFGAEGSEKVFARFINRLMARPVIRQLNAEPDPTGNVTSWEEGKAAAEAMARRILGTEQGENT